MHAIPLLLALLFAAQAKGGEYDLAIALELAKGAPAEQSVVAQSDDDATGTAHNCSPSKTSVNKSESSKNTEKSTGTENACSPVSAASKQAVRFRTETRYRTVRKRFCTGRGCYYRWVREDYQVKVPVASAANKNWPRYPTTPRQQPWTQGGRHITWQHLAEGENKVQWAYVVRP